MSHWKTGKLKLDCALVILQRALINIMPGWEKHIKVDASGSLPIHSNYQGTSKKTYSLVVPKGGDTGVSGSDLGFSQEEDGSWAITHDYLPHELRDPEGQIKQQVGVMRARAIAFRNQFQITLDQQIGEDHVIEMLVPEAQAGQFHA